MDVGVLFQHGTYLVIKKTTGNKVIDWANRIEFSFHLFIRRCARESTKRWRQDEEKPDPFGTWQFRFHLQRRLPRIILHLLRQTQSEIIINLRRLMKSYQIILKWMGRTVMEMELRSDFPSRYLSVITLCVHFATGST